MLKNWEILLLVAFFGNSHGVPLTAEESSKTPAQPRVSYSRDTLVEAGKDAVLDCAVEGIDLTNVEKFRIDWSKIDEENPIHSLPITNGDQMVFNPNNKYELIRPEGTNQYSLKVRDVQEDDTGLYRCLVYFAEDQFVTPKMYLNIKKAPYFKDPSTKSVVVTEGDNISLDCQPGGNPAPTAVWQKVVEGPTYYSANIAQSAKLDIQEVSVSDTGKYSCIADSGYGDPAKTDIILIVQFAPKVELSPMTGVVMNEEYSFECRIESYPDATSIAWFKGDDPVLGDVNMRVTEEIVQESVTPDPSMLSAATVPQIKVSKISISKVTFDSLGKYRCQAANEISSSDATTDIQLKTPPKIEKQSPRRQFYLDDEFLGRSAVPVAIECEASGVPTPVYRWMRNGKPLLWQANPRYSLDSESGSLLIDQPEIEDNGVYQCIAHNELGVARGDLINFFNATRVSFNASGGSIELEAEEGRPFKMICPNATSDPRPEITWVKSLKPVEGMAKMEYFNSSNRTVVGPDGTAYFTHVIRGDDSATSGVNYLCLGVNAAAPEDFSIGVTVSLKVVPPSDGIENADQEGLNIEVFLMYGSAENTILTGGQDNKLWCIYGGEPVPHVMWTDSKGNALEGPDYAFDNFNHTLIIKNTSVKHEGNYTCSASNLVGVVKSHSINVTVEMPPMFAEKMQKTQVTEGSSVTFVCAAEGSGILTYNWFYNGRELSTYASDGRLKADGNNLTILAAVSTDTGNYACNATSKYGYAYGQTTLNVLPSTSSAFNQVTGCPEVSSMRNELANVKDTLQKLRDFVQNTRTAQADASIGLIQRIADKLNILTDDERELIAAQYQFKRDQGDIKIKTKLESYTDAYAPLVVRGEPIYPEKQKQEEKVWETEVKPSTTLSSSQGSGSSGAADNGTDDSQSMKDATKEKESMKDTTDDKKTIPVTKESEPEIILPEELVQTNNSNGTETEEAVKKADQPDGMNTTASDSEDDDDKTTNDDMTEATSSTDSDDEEDSTANEKDSANDDKKDSDKKAADTKRKAKY